MKTILYCLLILYSINLAAQKSVLTILVQDSEKTPLSFANITISNESGEELNFLTDSVGLAKVELENQAWKVRVQYLGFTPNEAALILEEDFTLEINLSTSSEVLNEVTIVGQKKRIIRDGNNIKIDISGSTALGHTAMEIIGNSPGVVLINDQVTLLGKSVKFHINGKESKLSNNQLANLLNSKNAKGIKSIDLVSEPSAATDASFEGAVININTIPIIDGYQIGVSSRTTLRSSQLSQSGYLDFFINKNTFNIYGDFSLYRSGWQEIGSIERTISNQKLNEKNVDDIRGSGPSYSLGIDFLPSSIWNMGVKLEGYKDIDDKTLNGTTTVETSATDLIIDIFAIEETDQSFLNFNYNLAYASLNNKTNVTVDFDLGKISNGWNQEQELSTFLFDNNMPLSNLFSTQNIDSENSIKGVKIDATHKFGGIKFQGGLSSSSTIIKQFLNEQGENFILKGPNKEVLNYNEKINAVYLSISGKKIIGYQFGIRGELTDYIAGEEISMAETSQAYFQVFPRATIYKDIGKHYVSASYRRSIRRPRFNKLIPYNTYTGAFSYYSGNPDLRAYLPQSFTFRYNFDNRWRLSSSYSYAKDRILEYSKRITNSNLVAGVTENNGTSSRLNINAGFNGRLSSAISLNSNISYVVGKQSAFIGENRIEESFSYNAHTFYISSDIKLKKDWKLNVNGYYSSDIYYNINQNLDYGYLGLNLNRSIKGGSGRISFTVRDLLLTGISRSITNYGDIQESNRNDWGSRQFILAFNYSFSKESKNKQRNRNTTANSEAIRRF